MEYMQRAIRKDGHEMWDKVHLSDDGVHTLCGKELNHMWFVTGDEGKIKKDVTCYKCAFIQKNET